ncbi:MAG: fibronectin type III domain-containing protein [Saprospiraceae bacterium]
MLKTLVFLWLALPFLPGLTSGPPAVTCDCPDIADLQKTGQTSNSITFEWSPVDGATTYKVRYYRQDDQYTSSFQYTGQTSLSFTNLPEGTYTFYFMAVCGSGESGIVVEDLIQM